MGGSYSESSGAHLYRVRGAAGAALRAIRSTFRVAALREAGLHVLRVRREDAESAGEK